MIALWRERLIQAWRDRPRTVLLAGAVWVALVLGVLFRVVELDRFPGLNGDEAGGPTLVRRALAGDPMNWVTPTGREVSRPFMGIVALAELLGGPQPTGFLTLRLPAAVAGVLSMVFAWLILRRYDRVLALSVTLLVASLPLLVVISRVGSEVGIVPLPGLIAMAFALRQSLIPTLIALGVALNLHPIGLFFVPVAAFTLLFAALGAPDRTTPERAFRAAVVGAAFLALALVFAATGLSKSFQTHLSCVRVPELPAWGLDLLRQLTGTHPLTIWVGPFSSSMRAFNDYVLGGGLVVIFGVGFFLFAVRRRLAEAGFTVGVCVTYLFYFMSGGLMRVNPDHYHHAFVLGMPTAMVLGLMIREVFRSARWPSLATAMSTGVALVLLVTFGVQFFGGMAGTGGRGSPCHRTGVVEPKLAAYRTVLHDYVGRSAARPSKFVIITEEWDTQWGIKYLASGFAGAEVPRLEELGFGPGVPPLLAAGAYAVGYVGGKVEKIVTQIVPPGRLVAVEIPDSGGKPVLKAWWVRPESR